MRDTFALPVRSVKWMVLGRDRSIPHLGRKLYHLAMGLVCFGLYAFLLTREQAIMTLLVVGGTWVAMDLLRLRLPALNDAALRVFGPLMRREELRNITANTYYIAGILAITMLFPKPIVLLSVLFLAVGDPTAAIVGTIYGRRKLLGGKSVEGTLANFAASGVVAFLFGILYVGQSLERALVLGLIGGAVSAIAELLPLPGNDNLTIPVVSATLLAIVSLAMPLF